MTIRCSRVLVGPAIDLNLGLVEVAKFYYVGWHSPSSEMQFLVNPDAFNQLSITHQQILKQSMRLAAYDSFVKIVNENGIKMNALLKQHQISLYVHSRARSCER